jgi:5'-deoxynucleotidase
MKQSNFYALLFRQKYIKRWGLMRNVTEENLAEHSAETAIMTHALASIGNAVFGMHYDIGKAVVLALFHDAPEVVTGDLPTPIKYFNPQIRTSYAEIEENAVGLLLDKLPPELRPEYEPLLSDGEPDLHLLVKAADKLCAYIKCVEEEKSGNPEFRQARITVLKALEAIDSRELKWFREHLLPAFELTLDEI